MKKPIIEMIVMCATLTSEARLITKLNQAIDAYQDGYTLKLPVEKMKELQEDMSFLCLLFCIKTTGGDDDPMKMIKDVEMITRVKKMLNPDKN
jgi:hypothetical protein